MKRFFLVIFIVTLVFMLISCSSNQDYIGEDDERDNLVLLSETTPERKIIYTVDARYDVANLTSSVEKLKTFIQNDEWFDLENVYETNAYFVIRIKTERLDTFTNQLKTEFQVRSFSKEAKDISLQYQDKASKVVAINLQITRLLELYENASLSDMITINQQLSTLEVEKMNLEGELNLFDSLIDYSEVKIHLYGSSIVSKSPFFNRVGNGFINGFKAVIAVLDGIVIAIAHMIPFIVVFVPIGFGVYVGYKKVCRYRKNKKIIKREKTEEQK